MSLASALPYKLRPNKSVDRELFLSLLNRLGAHLRIELYKYIGLGGPFLEDFRLIHAKTGISDMVCLELEEAVHLRQTFNRPIESIDCMHSTLEDYLDENEFENPVVLWFDYSDPKKTLQQIETFSNQISTLPLLSIIRITLNANPSSLGNPPAATKAKSISVTLPGKEKSTDSSNQRQEWRLKKFKENMADIFPSSLSADDMTWAKFGRSLQQVLNLAVEKAVLPLPDRKVIWALCTHYSDGQPMITATVVIVSKDDDLVQGIVDEWNFSSTPQNPLILDLPALSTIERLTLISADNPEERLGYELPKSCLKTDPIENFKQFYRVFPHFSTVDV